MSTPSALAEHFDALFLASADPWATRTRWYERRKQTLTLAMLPKARYRRIFEPGCAVGELTAQLALRCDELVAIDGSALAVSHAQRRVSGLAHVRVERGHMPEDWPAGSFDLIVVSELAYYLDTPSLSEFATACGRSLTADGTLIACHWRRGALDMLQSAAHAHHVLGTCAETRVSSYEDADLLVDVWCRDARSVAQHEGIA